MKRELSARPFSTTREGPPTARMRKVLLPAHHSERGKGPAMAIREDDFTNPALGEAVLSIGGENHVLVNQDQKSEVVKRGRSRSIKTC